MSQTARCTPLRQSCDRCHHQKLRCARRNSSNTEACERCLQRQVPCIYSSSLPKGRPSIYSSSLPKERPSIRSTRRNSHKASSKKGHQAKSTSILTISPPIDGNMSEMTDQQTVSKGSECNSVSSCTPIAPNPNPSELDMSPDGWITQADAGGAQAIANSQLWPLTVDYPVMDASDSDLASLVPDSRPLVANNNHQPHEAIELSLEALPDSWADDDVEWGHLLLPEMETFIHPPTHSVDSTVSTPASHSESQTSLNAYDSSTIISVLSQLNARIALMQCLMDKVGQAADASAVTEGSTMSHANRPIERNMGVHQNMRPTRLLDNAALGSAATWLMREKHRRSDLFPSTYDYREDSRLLSSHLLEDIYSASNHFLECISKYCSTPTLDTTRGQLNETIRHLTIACHLLLMGIYETLLAVLEHDALLEKQTACVANDRDPLGQIQLVSVVQLCSYIFARQNEAINTYLSQNVRQHSYESDRGCSRATTNLDKQVRSEFANQLHERFQRLECILGFRSRI